MISDDTVSSDEILINAPAEVVWQVLVDFENYGQWNKFCPEIKTRLEIGAAVEMMCDLGHGLQQQVEYMTLIEPNRAIAWGMENKPGDPIHAVRTQRLTPIDEYSCTYISIDEFSGEAIADMLKGFGKNIEDGFNLCANGLKLQAEKLYKEAL